MYKSITVKKQKVSKIMSKILALDLGDQWIGTAISDATRIIARPFQTITIKDLIPFLQTTLSAERIGIVVVGYPKTLKGTHSQQTDIIVNMKHDLESQFPKATWVLWDERLTSKQAHAMASTKKNKNKQGAENKNKLHSVAAALILESYLLHLEIQSNKEKLELLDE